MLAIGRAFSGYYAISTRVHGLVLEQISYSEWLSIIPSLVSTLEALRLTKVPSHLGIGGWDNDGKPSYASWPEYLLSVNQDLSGGHTYSWRKKLAALTHSQQTFDLGFQLLQELVQD